MKRRLYRLYCKGYTSQAQGFRNIEEGVSWMMSCQHRYEKPDAAAADEE